ncbi:MAG TPA: penicillin-binding protein [Flavobacteriales bacterium]|nr:cell division protein [Flavobacteriales bacterium]HRE74982.1 penicillin-binding protein [Flavobacteriales bacterium]HRE95392.1 penicillin-binding protein [Flavobacteriales bacterium]HRJ36528.1 penicillin-binding protein [Flavobacteriales bacterium]HRJ38094.1 penicillin-binding protein [Flavobacteriales bacterium]
MKEKNDDRKDMMRRMYLVYLVLCVFALVVVVKVFRIQMDTVSVIGQPEGLLTDLRTIEAVRGNIYSDNGSLLATSIPVYEVRMDMGADGLTDEIFFDNVDSLAYKLSRLFPDKPKARFYQDLIEARKNGNRYYLVRAKVKHPELQAMKKFPIFKLGKNKGGLIVVKENKRSRPYGLLAARLIGYERPDPDNPQFISRIGLEGAFSKELSGTDGKQLMKKVGLQWRPVSDNYEVNPVDGADVFTSIDINIQDVAENALLSQLQKYEAKSGCVVLMEVETGMVKAMANLSIGEDGQYYEHFNHAIGTAIEPGSTFKTASLMVGFEDGMFKPSDSVKTGKGEYSYYNIKMKDTKPHGTITIKHALEVSSNIGCSKPVVEAYSRDPKRFIEGLKKMGIGELLGLDIAGEAKPYLKDPSNRNEWSGVTLPMMAIGYESKLAPIQILTFYNAIANNGMMVKPQFVQDIRRNGKIVKKYKPIVMKEKICSEKTLNMIRPMLEGVVDTGTAMNLKAANFSIAGKTGTAQIHSKGAYNKEKYLASFVGYFPADAPRYSCIVWVMEPNVLTGYYGNAVAGNVFKEIADKMYARSLEVSERERESLMASNELPVSKSAHQKDLTEIFKTLKIASSTGDEGAEWVRPIADGEKRIVLEKKAIAENKVPTVIGMGLKDALFLLENRGLVVKVKGSGKVKRQSLPEGKAIQQGETIEIELM